MTKVAILSGSHRENSQSLKIAKMIEGKLTAYEGCAGTYLLDMANVGLPFWKESYSEEEHSIIAGVKEQLVDADAYVVISPEWHGTVPSALKNLFLLFSGGELAHKPALIATVSAGIGGTYPVNELRTTTYKNSRICYIPEHLIFRHVTTLFNNSDDDDKKSEEYMSKRTDFCLDYLVQYSVALSQVRANAPESSGFANGM